MGPRAQHRDAAQFLSADSSTLAIMLPAWSLKALFPALATAWK
jgi:hypothetical protein